ncbi:MAG: type II toxin-antitoxin system RelE/ParE family toxin [Alphaproteobacteria bacterium]|nr:type II toxin-antitoxin system RelE/ParE family toxin [Alphaproteobacteria bacterium]MBU2378326.1 type II toxin-antitoxin system RelE/ParE family toxin [Alphaproteobacteria bacterium]
MLPVIWNTRARADLTGLAHYIAARNPDAAQRIKALLERAAERLGDHPYLHRVGRNESTRESVVHPNYVMVYRVDGDAVRILRVLHARQRYP